MTVAANVLTELPIFAYSGVLIKRIGHNGLLTIAMAALVVRSYWITLLVDGPTIINRRGHPNSTYDVNNHSSNDTGLIMQFNVHFIILIECLHGLTFACIWMVAIDTIHNATPVCTTARFDITQKLYTTYNCSIMSHTNILA